MFKKLIGMAFVATAVMTVLGASASATSTEGDEIQSYITGSLDASDTTAFNSLNGAQQGEIGEQLLDTGSINSATIATSMGTTQAFTGVTQGRAAGVRDSAMKGVNPYGAAGPEGAPMWGVWAEGVGTWGEQDDRDGKKGYDWDTYGAMVGVDATMGNLLIGMNVGYADTDIDSKVEGVDADSDNWTVGLYATYMIDALFIDGGISYTDTDTDTDRDIAGAGTADADYDSDTWGGYLGVGYYFVNGSWTVTPSATIAYSYYDQESYKESGATIFGLNQEFDDYDQDMFTSTLAVDAAYAINETMTWTMRAAWTHEYTDNQPKTDWRLRAAGAAWRESKGLSPADDTFNLGTGINAQLSDNASVYLNYDVDLKDDYDAHNVTAGLRVDF